MAKANAVLSIVMDETKTHRLKGLAKRPPFAVIEPSTLFVSEGKIKGLALYACNQRTSFEMSIEEFKQLTFEFVKNTA